MNLSIKLSLSLLSKGIPPSSICVQLIYCARMSISYKIPKPRTTGNKYLHLLKNTYQFILTTFVSNRFAKK